MSDLRMGVAGWSYPDWEGVVYPAGKVDQLVHVARIFDVIEINTTFYHPVAEKVAASWIRRTAHLPEFLFTVKLWRRFTHEADPYGKLEIEAATPALRCLAEGGRLGAVLVQFPYSFKNAGDARERLQRLFDAFRAFPLVVEVRHASLDTPRFYEFLREQKVGFCNVDQPLVSRSIGPTAQATSEIGYIRLHGRNAQEWFKEDTDRNRRYDYLYSMEELNEIASRVRAASERTSRMFIIANNHYRGQAAANSLQLKNLLTGQDPAAPGSLVRAFPALASCTRPAELGAVTPDP